MNTTEIQKLDEVAKQGNLALSIVNQFEKTFAIANCAQQLRKLLTPEIMKPIMELQGSKLGFRTDKVYSETVVKDCLIEATINGLFPVGNQFNIIANNFYVTKEGFYYKLKNLDGLAYTVTLGIPKMMNGGAVVDAEVEWSYRGQANKKNLSFAIKVNAGMGADAINGKATRKTYCWLFNTITGQSLTDGDVTDNDTIEARKSKLERPMKQAEPAGEPETVQAEPVPEQPAPQTTTQPAGTTAKAMKQAEVTYQAQGQPAGQPHKQYKQELF